MLLERLGEYAAREGKEIPPAMYESIPIKWLVDLDVEGEFQGLVATSGDEKRKNDRGKEYLAPAVIRSSGIKPRLLADRVDYALGLVEAGAGEKRQRRANEAHQAFVELVTACARATRLPEVIAVEKFLRDLDLEHLLPHLSGDMDPEAHNLTFRVNGILPVEAPEVRNFWARLQASQEDLAQCLVCGEYKPPVKRHPVKIKGIPGGQPSGMALVSANARAFESYGLEASLVAPICQECAENYGRAINELVRDPYTHLTVGPCVYLFWTRGERGYSPASILAAPEPEEVRHLINSVYRSREPVELDPTDFYAISLTSSGGRVAVRDWLVTTVGELQVNLGRYFASQRLVDWDGSPGPPVGLHELVGCLVLNARNTPPNTPRALLQTALYGVPLPPRLLYQAVRRCAIERKVTRPRAMVIKMALLSMYHCGEKEDELMEELDLGNRTPAYLCGRLLAVLEFIQKQAQGTGIKATLVDRYYGTASAAPASVYGRLLRTAQSHLAKVRKEKPGAHGALQRLLEEILSGLKPSPEAPSGFPLTLKLDEQGLFALGYYHQRAAGWGKISESV